MPLTAMLTALRLAPTDITDMLRTPARRMDTMARHGLAAESLLGRVRGIGMPIMAVAITAIAVDTAIVAGMVMATDTVTVMGTLMAVAATEADITVVIVAATMAAAVTTVVADIMVVVVTAAGTAAATGSFAV